LERFKRWKENLGVFVSVSAGGDVPVTIIAEKLLRKKGLLEEAVRAGLLNNDSGLIVVDPVNSFQCCTLSGRVWRKAVIQQSNNLLDD